MKIDGKAIADKILEDLTLKVKLLKEKGIVPTLAVILVGDNPASLSYIKQKQKTAERIGATLQLHQASSDMRQDTLLELITKLNVDPQVHGIIVQRPLPKASSINNAILKTINQQKDVDGFVPNSPFAVPVARAVIMILRFVFSQLNQLVQLDQFDVWLKKKRIVIIGKGETAGRPIADYLAKQHCTTSTIHSQTANPQKLIRNADIVISCVGKERVVTKDMIKSGSILISVGIWRDSEGKLHGDYEEEDVKDTASFYTPTPGGVGPVNVACLMQNVVEAVSII